VVGGRADSRGDEFRVFSRSHIRTIRPEECQHVAREQERREILKSIVDATMLKRGAALDDVGKVAAFAASDHARTMTATALNISCGNMVD
jgi:enoyl-[acyl-carrier-protein] reductase (NADH)